MVRIQGVGLAKVDEFKLGVGKLWPAGRMRPAVEFYAAREAMGSMHIKQPANH